MKSVILFLFAILICKTHYSQNGIKDWDINYKIIDVKKLLDYEEEYAKKVESDKEEAQYYVAMESYRFIAEFTGRKRALKDEIFTSMKHVLKIKTGNPEMLNNLVSKELEFKIDSTTIWIVIQNQLIEPFFQEVKKGEKVLLYTLFTNEHMFEGGYINSFLISEFTTEWTD